MRIKILARKKLKMSPGKLAAQAVHAELALNALVEVDPLMSVIVLSVNDAPFNRAKAEHSVIAVVHDAGFTEVSPARKQSSRFSKPIRASYEL